jgi:hypothetical protein
MRKLDGILSVSCGVMRLIIKPLGEMSSLDGDTSLGLEPYLISILPQDVIGGVEI